LHKGQVRSGCSLEPHIAEVGPNGTTEDNAVELPFWLLRYRSCHQQLHWRSSTAPAVTNIRNTNSPRRRGWLKPETRGLVTAMSFPNTTTWLPRVVEGRRRHATSACSHFCYRTLRYNVGQGGVSAAGRFRETAPDILPIEAHYRCLIAVRWTVQ
jgi:hypothetical protein